MSHEHSPSVVTEAELLAFVDGQLPPPRRDEVQAWLDRHPEHARRIEADLALNRQMREHFGRVLEERLPPRLVDAAQGRERLRWRLAAAFAGAIVLAGGVGGWMGWSLRHDPTPTLSAEVAPAFARRAMVAHAVYAPDQRRAVEVDAAHEDQLVRWLSRRLGAPLRVPHLQGLGFALEGGRLLPGRQGPVAQFMYRRDDGQRLTLYVSNEMPLGGAAVPAPAATSFRFASEGEVNSFYWIDGHWGYAISAGVERQVLAEVSAEVFRQLGSPGAASAGAR